MQGVDAGGHGFEKGAGIISLLPETAEALQRHDFEHIPLVAAGSWTAAAQLRKHPYNSDYRRDFGSIQTPSSYSSPDQELSTEVSECDYVCPQS
jgi:fructoselysine-6-P-deglycase FrlB-like protein